MAKDSPLSGMSSVELPMFSGDTEYSSRLQSVKSAEDKLRELLKERTEQPRVSPSMLAMAGEFLDPGRTGSFGESLGRAAKAYAATRGAEDKEAQENAMMRLQLERMGLQSAQKGAALRSLNQASGAPAPGAAPAAGGAPQQGEMAIPINGMNVTPTFIRNMMIADPDLGNALKAEYEMRLNAITTQPSGAYNKLTGQFTPFAGAAPISEPIPELGNRTLPMAPEDAAAIRAARSKGDAPGVYSIIDRYTKGVGARPGATTPATTPAASPVAATVEARESQKAGETTRAQELAKVDVADITAMRARGSDATYAAQTAANRAASLAQSNPNAFGVLAKPGVGTALATLVSQGLQTPGGSLNMKGFEEAILKANPKTTPQDLAALSIVAGDLAQIELEYTRDFLQKQGQVTEGERAIVRRVGSSTSDKPEVIALKSQAVARRKQFDIDAASAFDDYMKRTDDRGNVREFKRSDEYKRLKNDYENWIAKRFNISQNAPTGAPVQLNATSIQEEMARRGIQ